jgi:8-oxo-dGTP pyrophosphatase MutT (NUDIX family)
MKAASFFLLEAEDTGRALFLLRKDGSWGLPGGMREPGDHDELDTACRELAEETRYTGLVRVGRPLVGFVGDVDFVTFVATVPREFAPLLDDEHWSFSWSFPENLAAGELRPLHPGLELTLGLR